MGRQGQTRIDVIRLKTLHGKIIGRTVRRIAIVILVVFVIAAEVKREAAERIPPCPEGIFLEETAVIGFT